MRIMTYNLNGVRSANKKGVCDFLNRANADFYCLQETRATAQQICEELAPLEGKYQFVINESERKGYSGTAVLAKVKPISYENKLFDLNYDTEGRLQVLEYENFFLINLYTPNGGTRLEYKMQFIDDLIQALDMLIADGKDVILCTDFNIAHTELDLSNPEECARITGFLPQEREIFDKFLSIGMFDVFRELHPNEKRHTWSSYASKRASDNFGNLYTFDYIFVTENLLDKVRTCEILHDAMYSDHYPVKMEIDL